MTVVIRRPKSDELWECGDHWAAIREGLDLGLVSPVTLGREKKGASGAEKRGEPAVPQGVVEEAL